MEAVKLQLTTHMASISTSQSIRLSSSGIWEVWIRMSRDGRKLGRKSVVRTDQWVIVITPMNIPYLDSGLFHPKEYTPILEVGCN